MNDQFFKESHIDEIFYTKPLISEIDLNGKLIKIMTLVILYWSYGKINPHFLFINNARDSSLKCTKYYLYKFFKKIIIQKMVILSISAVIMVVVMKFSIYKIEIKSLL